ncbi:MAG: LuxR family transcriptional regulator [Acidimicrobiia bacterium]|nr:MAG: LuxR family transcriptional regulator [Acidimicrobiia bacterium]
MAGLPEGIVTFLFTDVEGSTKLWEEAPDSMMEAVRQHDQAIEQTAVAHHGIPVRPRGEGDSRFVVFSGAPDAVAAAADIQRRLVEIEWATPRPLRVRIALHTGTADLQLGDYYGSSVNRAARLRAIAHGGQTLMSGSTWELVQDQLPANVTVQDMGKHRLKDLTRPERVYQIDAEGLDDGFPPLDSLDAVPNNLPVQLTDFVGRPEVADIKRIIGETRLLTILAPGGAGKTRLAIQAAADLAADYPDGVFFVDLAPVTSPADIAQTVAESIGVALATDEDLQTQLLARLANEQQLLVFDNFEHLADGAGIVSEILTAAPKVKVIATSRARLNITGETVFALPGLVITWEMPEQAFDASGVRLFIDAAKRADASFSLQVDELDPLATILDLVDGMPLGILLAASWADTLRVDEIATEIGRSMDFLETETRDMPDRHRSMRAVFDYSWSMLSEDEQRTYAALSVFRGGFTREAADAVAGASLRGLSNMAGKSLVVSDRDSGRYSIHELLRQYAEEELQKDQQLLETMIVGHNTFFAKHASQIEALMLVGDEVEALRLVEDDLDNIRWAWSQVQDRGDAESARSIIFGLWFLYEIRGWTKAASELFAEASDAFADGSEDNATEITRALIDSSEAKYLASLGQTEAAAPLAAKAVAMLRGRSDPFALIMALEVVGEVSMYLGQFDRVLDIGSEARRVADDAGLEMWSAGMLNYQALAHLQMGDVEAASRLLDEGDAVLARLGEHFMRTWNLATQAIIAMMQGRIGDAIDLYQQQAELAREVGYIRAVAIALQGLGQAYASNGDLDAASDALVESLDIFDRMGLVTEMAGVLVMIARVRTETGRAEQAVEILSCVLADPSSDQMFVFEQQTITEAAEGVLEQLEAELDPDLYAAARARGAAITLDVAVKELLTAT